MSNRPRYDANTPLPADVTTITAAKAFVLERWQERAREQGQAALPPDLSGACKFSSHFASLVFGGDIRGNLFHQWVELPDGRILDLNEDAEDVALLKAGEIPEYARQYAQWRRQSPPEDVYTHDPKHMRRLDQRRSMASVRPRAERWADAFRGSLEPVTDKNAQRERVPAKRQARP